MNNKSRLLFEVAPILITLLAVIVLLIGGVYVPGQQQVVIDPASTNLADLRKLVRLGSRSSCTSLEYSNQLTNSAENDVVMTIEIEWRTIGQEPVEKKTFEVDIPAMSDVPVNFAPPSETLDEAITSCGVNIIDIEIQ